MKKNTVFTNIIGLILSLLLLASLVLSFVNNADKSVLRVLISVISIAALGCAVIYYLNRKKKQADALLQAYTFMLCLIYFLSLLHGIILARSVPACALTALAFGSVCALAATRDTDTDSGRKRAQILSMFAVTFQLIQVVITSVRYFSAARLIRTVSGVLLALILVTFILLRDEEKN